MIKIWDNHNHQWLQPMSIHFDKEGNINRVTACIPGVDILSQCWYVIEGKDLDKIAIVGSIEWNVELMPKI